MTGRAEGSIYDEVRAERERAHGHLQNADGECSPHCSECRRTWEVGGKWHQQLVVVVASIEAVPHPPWCSEWDEDGCNCGIEASLVGLYALVDASCDVDNWDLGRVPEGHPLQVERNRRFRAYERRQRPWWRRWLP